MLVLSLWWEDALKEGMATHSFLPGESHGQRSLVGCSPWSYEESVQFSSVAQSCPTLCDPQTTACQASLSITISWSLPKLMSIESVMPSNHFILCCPLLLPPSIFPSIRMSQFFASGGPKYWSFSFSISPSNRYSGFISFRMD